VIREEESNPMLAHFLMNSIRYLDALEDPLPDFHIIFMFHLTRHLGFYPRNNYGESYPYFDLVSGHFQADYPGPESHLGRETSALWSACLSSDFQETKKLGLNSQQRKNILDLLVKYYRSHVAGMREIKSLEVLHTFFHNV
jgi:DNA repair protein RecO (recombination protein O)